MPHLRDRPFTMKRYPDGWQGKFFFQKDAPKHMPDWIPTRQFEASTRDRPPKRRLIDFALVQDELALLWMANMGCIDMNTWYSRVDKPSRPDWVLFDLDPSEDVGFAETIEVARLIKETLDLLELESFPKTSGSEGITSSSRSAAATPTRRRGSSPRSWPARSRGRTRALRRPSGCGRSGAAS